MAQSARSTGFLPDVYLTPLAVPMWNGLLRSNTLVSASAHGGDVIYASAGYIRNTQTTDKFPVGVAVTPQATSVTTNVSMLFYPAVPWIVFGGQYGGTATQAKVWTAHSIAGTRGKQEVSDSAGAKCTWIIGKDPNSSFGAYTRVRFVFMQSKFYGNNIDTSNAPGV